MTVKDESATKESGCGTFGNFFRALTLGLRIELKDDEWEYTEEPHVSRRQEILKKHPEIKKLMGSDPSIAIYVFLEVFIQMLIAYTVSAYQPDWVPWFLLTYIVGATLNHSLACAIHEIGHNLAFGHKYGNANRLLSLFCNLPMIVPVAISYRKYHHEHHRWLGHEDLDTDIPMKIEAALFKSPASRIVWLLINPLFYTLRPFFKAPRPLNVWEVLNVLTQVVFGYIIWRWLGTQAFMYLFIGTLLGFGIHPMSAHVISEHYLFADNLATHSYYGSMNFLMFNLGYHVEHHDFPYIPFSRLPQLKKLAPEYYDHLPYHSSMCKVLWDFIFLPGNGPQARSVTTEDFSKPHLYDKMQHFDLTSALTYPSSSPAVADAKQPAVSAEKAKNT
ncbi:hypothetical protein AAHC03_024536 [Spirometra sp. Aus1]